jgi:uncharacterized protein YjbJ (UPF0337 family)
LEGEVEDVMHTDRNLKTQATGAAQTVLGRIWRALGRLLGSPRMQVEGTAEEVRGRANVARGKAAERVEGGVAQAQGTLERKVGEAMGNEPTATEGRAKELEGKARQVFNR